MINLLFATQLASAMYFTDPHWSNNQIFGLLRESSYATDIAIVTPKKERRVGLRVGNTSIDSVGGEHPTLFKCYEQLCDIIDSTIKPAPVKLNFFVQQGGRNSSSRPMNLSSKYLIVFRPGMGDQIVTKEGTVFASKSDAIVEFAMPIDIDKVIVGNNLNESIYFTMLSNAAISNPESIDRLLGTMLDCPESFVPKAKVPYTQNTQAAQLVAALRTKSPELQFVVAFHLFRWGIAGSIKTICALLPKLSPDSNMDWIENRVVEDPTLMKSNMNSLDELDTTAVFNALRVTHSAVLRRWLANSMFPTEEMLPGYAALIINDDQKLQDIVLKTLYFSTEDKNAVVTALLGSPEWKPQAEKAIAYWRAKYKF